MAALDIVTGARLLISPKESLPVWCCCEPLLSCLQYEWWARLGASLFGNRKSNKSCILITTPHNENVQAASVRTHWLHLLFTSLSLVPQRLCLGLHVPCTKAGTLLSFPDTHLSLLFIYGYCMRFRRRTLWFSIADSAVQCVHVWDRAFLYPAFFFFFFFCF